MIQEVLLKMEKELADCVGISVSKIKLLVLSQSNRVCLIFKEEVKYTRSIGNKIDELCDELEKYNLFLTYTLNNPEVII